jgi:hypothetical protein
MKNPEACAKILDFECHKTNKIKKLNDQKTQKVHAF